MSRKQTTGFVLHRWHGQNLRIKSVNLTSTVLPGINKTGFWRPNYGCKWTPQTGKKTGIKLVNWDSTNVRNLHSQANVLCPACCIPIMLGHIAPQVSGVPTIAIWMYETSIKTNMKGTICNRKNQSGDPTIKTLRLINLGRRWMAMV